LELVALAVVVHAIFQDMRSRPVRLGESIQRGLRRFFPLIGGAILVALGLVLTMFLAMLLVAVPGSLLFPRSMGQGIPVVWFAGIIRAAVPILLLYMRWYVFPPVCVLDKKGPLGSLGRSAELTRDNRWKLFAIFIMTMLVAMLAGGAIKLLGLANSMPILLLLGIQGVWQGVWFAFNSILGVVIYHDLRVTKEGADIESIASVFD
jgi:hypothetical protein